MTDDPNIHDDIKHLADSIGHTSEAVVILDAVVDYAIRIDQATCELNQRLFDVMTKMDDLSPELQDWLEARKGMFGDGD